MRALDLRRHSMRDPGGVHLNDAGVALARRVGAATRPFARVVSSPVPRAVETAAAIGGGPIEIRKELAPLGPAVERALGPIVRWSDYAVAVRRAPRVAAFAASQGALLAEVVRSLPEGGRALVVSHGGVVELGAVAALPEAPHDEWGGPASYCEGIRLEHESGRFVRGTVLRVDPT